MTPKATAVQDDMRPAAVDIVQPLSSKSLFWQAGYLAGSAAVPVLPFLFWTIESAAPRILVALGEATEEPYFAMCQAVQRLGLETLCFSILGTAPDPAALRHNTDTYEDFSILQNEPQAVARARFDVASIDVLYLDLAHLPEDLTSWNDLLSPRSVLLIHGVRDPELAKPREACLDQLRIKHIDFTLEHGAGLGMVLGADAPARLKRLAQLHMGVPGHSEVQKVFFRLGKAHENAFKARHEHRERVLLKEELAEMRQALGKAKEERKALHEKTLKLRSAYEERNAQIALIEARHFDEVSDLRQALADSTARESECDWLRGEVAKYKKQTDTLTRSAEEAKTTADAEIQTLNDKLEERTTELVALTQLFEAEKAQNVRALADRREWQDIRIELRDAEIAMLRGAGSRLRRGDAPSRAGLPSHKKQIETLRHSNLFDAEWYLKTYPDVAESRTDPIRHYMLHGALDGRNPGPAFDTLAYYRANRDVAQLGFNALVHYEMFGRDEKRKLGKDG